MNTTEHVEPFSSWEDRHRSQSSLVDEARGWGRRVDLDNDEAVLAWAREYLPRIVALGARPVDGGAA